MADTQKRRISGLTVVIDRDLCIGSGNCAKVAPEVFELDATGIITFRGDAPETPEIERDRLVESCRVCPVDAVTATDADGRQLSS